MNIFQKIKRHAAIATGNFDSIFKDTADIPPLPAATARLISEINKSDPDFDKLEIILASSSGLAAKMIKTVNSSLYSLRNPVSSIRHAISMLGIKRIRELVLAYSVMESLPLPDDSLFDHEAFWSDSLIMAFFARAFSGRYLPEKADEAFVTALLSDLALPVLLTIWGDYYAPILQEWRQTDLRLSEIERQHYKWDHGQAGAWIVKSWNFSDEIICYLGAHNLSISELEENGLRDTIALPIAISSLIGSVLQVEKINPKKFIDEAIRSLGYSPPDLIDSIHNIKHEFNEIRSVFNLPERNCNQIFEKIIQSVENEGEKC